MAVDHRPVLVWLRSDLRLADNRALHAAACSGSPVVPVFVYAPAEEGPWPLGDAARDWLRRSLEALRRELCAALGSELVLRCAGQASGVGGGSSADVLAALAAETGARACFWNRCYEPWCLARDAAVERALAARGVESCRFAGNVLHEPWAVRPDERAAALAAGFGTFASWAAAVAEAEAEALAGRECARAPLPRPAALPRPAGGFPYSAPLERVGPAREGAVADAGEQAAQAASGAAWPAGEAAALGALRRFVAGGLRAYNSRERQRADREGSSSRLSPHLRFGELSPRQVLAAAREAADADAESGACASAGGEGAVRALERRLMWRDMAYWALWRFPPSRRSASAPAPAGPDEPPGPPQASSSAASDSAWGWVDSGEAGAAPIGGFRAHYDEEEWAEDGGASLAAWQRGRTGFPLVDAAMRQLARDGWMPNYLRHVTAQFLVEFLHVDWRHGLRWFAARLLDADAAVNLFMWQNGGHCGMDQWCFVMHPISGARACDPSGDYVRAHVPELRRLAPALAHCPWDAADAELEAAGVRLGETYPDRILPDLDAARARSLAAVLRVRERHRARLVGPGGLDVCELGGARLELATRKDFRAPFVGGGQPARGAGPGEAGGAKGRGRGGRGKAGRAEGRGEDPSLGFGA